MDAQRQHDNDQDLEFTIDETTVDSSGRGFFGTFLQFMMMLFAGAGLGLAAYQHFARAPITRSEHRTTQQFLVSLKGTIGGSEKEIKAFRDRIDELWRLSGIVEGQLKQTEARSQLMKEALRKEIESVSDQAKAIERGLSVITEVYVNTPLEDRKDIDFGIDDGTVILPDGTAGAVQLTDTTMRRSGGDIVISCLLTCPQKNLRVSFRRSSVTTGDGTTIRIGSINIGKTKWGSRYLEYYPVDLHAGISVSVQLKLAVPEYHNRFSLLELALYVEGAVETIPYRNLAVP
ncbi:MAG: hypothetical protein O7G83_13850 [Proteobacteria bacterium]|nr:hypothetical protein [Pseudomonadota bacterium]